MSSWVHCNVCFIPAKGNNSIRFCLTSCGHVICKPCVTKGVAAANCPSCSQRKPGIVDIDRNLDPELQEYFKTPLDLHADMMKTLVQVAEFQATQRVRLHKHFLNVKKNFSKMEEVARSEYRKAGDLKGQVHQLKEKATRLTKENEELRKLLQNCPRPPSNNNPFEAVQMNYRNMVTSTPKSIRGIHNQSMASSSENLSFLERTGDQTILTSSLAALGTSSAMKTPKKQPQPLDDGKSNKQTAADRITITQFKTPVVHSEKPKVPIAPRTMPPPARSSK